MWDGDAGKEGVISDVKHDGTYILREVYSWALTWTVPSNEKLTVTVPRLERLKRQREA